MDVDRAAHTLRTDELDALFSGGGELGRAMAERDWGSTPLGPSSTWPASLRSAVRILLTSRFSMWMAWGPELTMLYNDAYQRDTLRAKHPWALGQPASVVWAEVWDDVASRIASVLEHGTATWDEDLLLFLERSGYPEETYHTFSYSPLSDDTGAVAGMLCVVTEETDRVLSERRMSTLRDLATDIAAGHTREDVLAAVEGCLGENPKDLPFTLTYLVGAANGDEPPRLAATTGIAPGDPAAPPALVPGCGWPVDAPEPMLVEDLGERFPDLPSGAWAEPPQQAVVVPLMQPGQGGPAGFVIAGLNPFRAFDDRYRGFVELLASQITSGLANAGAYEAERRRAEALAELDRAKTEFFTGISHEFRTPLTLIMGPLDELRASPAIAADARLATELDVAHRNGMRLAKLVNTLLDFSRLQAGRLRARFEPVDLPGLTAELASVFRSAMERAGLEFTVDCPPASQPVYVDREMWEKVVLNLLSNALKFTFEGGVTVTVRVAGQAAMLTVADTGSGVPEEELPHLFERFHRVPHTRARSGEGSGIGLAMVRELVALHGGTIGVRSTAGAGTKFTVELPLGRGHLPPDQIVTDGAASDARACDATEPFVAEALRWLPSETDTAGPATATAAGPAARVLVADDNADMREYLQRLLSPRYTVSLAADGTAAMAAARADPPDLIVSDVMMPGLNGMELLAALRRDPRTARVPVVLLSARAGQEAAVEGLTAGADDYLVKPFAAAELLARVDGHVRLSRVRGEAERRFRTLADATPALVWADGPDAHRIFVNRAWSEFVGTEGPDEDLGRRWRERIHPQDRDRYDAVRAERAGEPFEVEYRLRSADGRYRWVLDRGAPIDGGGYVGGCLDIDTRYRERERQRILAAVGIAMDRETSLDRRRDALVRALVSEGLVQIARLIAVDDGTRVVAAAAADPATERLIARIEPDWAMVRSVLDTGEAIRLDVDEDYLNTRVADDHQRELRRALGMRSVTFAPLTTRGRTAGTLVLSRHRGVPEDDAEDLALLVDIGRRAATALDNAQLYEREQATSRRLALLQRATAALSAAATPAQVAQVAVGQFRVLLGASAAGLWELRGATLDAVALLGWTDPVVQDWRSFPLDAPVAVRDALEHRTPVWVERAADWERRYPHMQRLVADYGYRSIDVLPLVAGNNAVGVAVVGFDRERVLDATERATAVALADQCAQAFHRASLLATESAARRAAEEFGDIVGALSGATTPAEVTSVILGHASALGAVASVVVLREGDQLNLVADDSSPSGLPVDRRLDLAAAHPIARAVRTGEPVWHDAGATPASPDQHYNAAGVDLPAQVVLPLVLGGVAIGALGMRFAAAERDTKPLSAPDERTAALTIAGQCAQALDRARLHEAEHEVADVLQRSLLPRGLPPLAALDAAARYLPGAAGSQTGGDWYDLLPLADGRAALVVGDVVGQGPGAAAVMGQLRSALAGYLLEGHPPAAALELLDAFAHHVPGARGSTCACLVVDRDRGELRWARAGHLPVLLVDGDGARLLEGGAGTVLAVAGRPPYAEDRVDVAPGASVVLYTDGLVERRGEVLDEGLARLVAAAGPHAAAAPDRLVRALLAASATGLAHDDVAVIAARLMPGPLRERLPARPATLARLRRAVQEWARTAGLNEDVLDDLQLALGEAAANAVEHAYRDAPEDGGTPEFEYAVLRRPDGVLDVTVRDFGSWRPPPPDPGYRGRGVPIVRAIAAEVQVDPAPDGTTVRFTLTPPEPKPELEPGTAQARDAATPAARPATAEDGRDAAGRHRVRVSGEVDLPAADGLRRRLLASVDRAADTAGDDAVLVVDLDAVTYLASAGVGLLLETVQRARTRGVALDVRATPGGIAARVLGASGLAGTLGATAAQRAAAPDR